MRVVFNTKNNKYEIHRGLLTHQVWENDTCYGGGYWWTFYPDNATQFDSPEEAMRVYNSRRKEKTLPKFVTVRRFW